METMKAITDESDDDPPSIFRTKEALASGWVRTVRAPSPSPSVAPTEVDEEEEHEMQHSTTHAVASDVVSERLASTACKEQDKETEEEVAARSADQPPPPSAKRAAPHVRRSGRTTKQPRRSFPPQSAASITQDRPTRASVDNAAAFNTDGISIGQELLALGLSPSGERVWYRATVTALRKPPSWPPIVVKV